MFQKILSQLIPSKSNRRKKSFYKKKHNFFGYDQQSLFQKRRKKISVPYLGNLKHLQNKKLYISLVGLLFILTCFLWVFGSTYFTVTKINIFRKDPIINIDRAYNSVDYLRGKNIFLIDSKEIAARIQKAQNSISTIKISTSIPHTLNIYLGSHAAIFQTDTNIILSNGSVLYKDNEPNAKLPLIHTSIPLQSYIDFSKNLPTKDLKQILYLLSYAEKNIFGFSANKISYHITEREVLISSNNVIYIFNLDDDIEKQVKKIAIFEKEKEKIGEKKYIYIDMRVNGKVFLCSSESEFDCKYNLKQIYGTDIIQILQEGASELIQ